MHWYLFPFSILFQTIVATRNKFFDWGWIKSKGFELPIISVGNISVGGTGKTPHIEYLIKILNEKYSLGIISRGYKRKTTGFIEVTTRSKVSEVGDEPIQIKQKFQKTLVIVDEKRVHAVEKLMADNRAPDIILLDDSYQHRYIVPGLNILLIDYNHPITKDYILPVGRLREPAQNSNRADIVILTKCPGNLKPIDYRIMIKELNLFPFQKIFFTTFKYNSLIPLFSNSAKVKNLKDLSGIATLIVTGIANPEPVYRKLENVNAKITKIAFPDHHEFKLQDINKILNTFLGIKEKQKIVLCTEKDAVRFKTGLFLKQITDLPIYYLPIEVSFLKNDEPKFKSIIEKFISEKISANN